MIGLGNPEAYKFSRHNIGKQFLDCISTSWTSSQYGYLSNTSGIILYKPIGYMNLCGIPISFTISKLKIPLENIIILHDDIELDIGKVKLKKEGSAQGHNGMRSIINQLQTNKIQRLRIGIGRPSKDDVSDYVLSNFNLSEKDILIEEVFPKCKQMLGIINN